MTPANMTPAVGLAPGAPPGPGTVARVAGGRAEVGFLGFGQTRDAKQRLVRYQVTNTSSKPIRSVRLRLRYFDHEGKARGTFPLQVVRPKGKLGPGVTLRESFELLGNEGPPEAVTAVRIDVERITYEDGSHWP